MRELHQRGPSLTFDGGMYWYEMREREERRERGREEMTRRILYSLFLSHLSSLFLLQRL